VYLVCRDELPKKLGYRIVSSLFDHLLDLLLAHTRAKDIKLTRAFDLPEGLGLHEGAEQFREQEERRLLIATGALKGRYYELGRVIQALLEQRRIRARAVHTDGSLENAMLLTQRPTLAIMQYDAALASRFWATKSVYKVDLSEDETIPKAGTIRRIAVLHTEKLHAIAIRAVLEGLDGEREVTLEDLRGLIQRRAVEGKAPLRVCLGPRHSGTQLLAKAVLKHPERPATAVATHGPGWTRASAGGRGGGIPALRRNAKGPHGGMADAMCAPP
jgi:TRAP-type uncharacterized transport system substrate-binding protein